MKKLTALVLFSFLAAASVRASLLWYDNFQYTNGPVILGSEYTPANGPVGTNSLWVREGGSAATSDMYVVNSNLQVAATGGTAISRQDDCFRLFVQTNWFLANAGIAGGAGNYGSYTNNLSQPVQLIYASFTVICATSITNYTNTLDSVVNSNAPVISGIGLPNGAGSYFASFYNTFYGYCGRVQAFTNGTLVPNTWRLGVTDNTLATNAADGGFPVDLAVNTPYQVVEEFDPTTLKAASIWVNPISINQSGASPVDTVYIASDKSNAALTNALNSFAFRQASSFGNATFLITNCDIATTFAEAMTNIWATNALPPTIIYQPAAVNSNFVGSTFSLYSVANGQGLASMTYQWQISSSPDNSNPVNVSPDGDYSGVNRNILTLNGAQTTDSGYLTLVATTPYGLSVTSSVAKVAISSAPVPPAFVANGEPVSQSIYGGQNVTFSTTVSSPGDISYTWYSNNVVISSTDNPSPNQSDNGESSYYTLNDVTTNVAASYSVAVTNDIAANGIVSSNAVLTVLTPQAVSIAYLRSLVDPVSFNSTNVPPSIPYQATGIITSYTNMTTGNTANYYLQDATAGIDIFVTGGSTFRPQLGDVVTFVGVLSTYNGATAGLELYADSADDSYPYTSYTIISNNFALPAARVIPFTVTNDYGYLYVNTNLMGSLVTLTNVYFGTNGGTVISTSADEALTVTNAGGLPFALEFYNLDLDTAGQTLPAFAYSVTGNLIGYQPNVILAVTKFSNIVTTPSTIIPTVSAGITGFSITPDGNVVITGTNAQTAGVYYLMASTNMALPLNLWTTVATNVVNTNGANGAFTFTGTGVVSPGGQQQFYILSNTNFNPQ